MSRQAVRGPIYALGDGPIGHPPAWPDRHDHPCSFRHTCPRRPEWR
jgi:hypothetical protein